jgi:hypothetical protein
VELAHEIPTCDSIGYTLQSKLRASSEALALATLAALLICVTAITPVDNAVRSILEPMASNLFSPNLPVWTFTITTGFMTIGLLVLMFGRRHQEWGARAECWRANGIFLVLLVLIGPALADSLGLPPCATGFYGAAGWWIGKRDHAGWAALSLASGVVLGLSLGLQGIATGSHSLSDVLWSGLAILGLCHILYYYVLRLPDRLLFPTHLEESARLPGLSAMCLLLVVVAVARLPHATGFAVPHWVAHIGEHSPVHLQQVVRMLQPRLR